MKDEITEILRLIERNFSKAMILAEEEPGLDDVNSRLALLKKSTVNLIFDIKQHHNGRRS